MNQCVTVQCLESSYFHGILTRIWKQYCFFL